NDQTELTMGAMAGDKPMKPAHVRFWVELLNPTSTPSLAPTTHPLGDGSVQLRTGAANPYRLQVFQDPTGTVAGNLQQPQNVTGNVTGPELKIEYDFSTAGGVAPPPVRPNNANYGGPPPTYLTPGTGVALVGPTVGMPVAGQGPQPFEFNPAGVAAPVAPWDTMIQSKAVDPAATGIQNAME